MKWIDIIGLLAGLCTTLAVLPQIIKAWNIKKVEHISPLMFAILIVGVGLWVVYGLAKNDFPIIATNGVSLSLNAVMLYLMIRYK